MVGYSSSNDQKGTLLKGLIFDIKRFAIHDGPGIRTTVFFKGCPLRCPWCHNPEGISSLPEIIVSDDRCIACFDCVEACPRDAIEKADVTVVIDRSTCDLCGECAKVCHAEAIEIIGREITTDELMDEIRKDKIFYDQSGGGVTFSGGEPLMQLDFLREILRKCKEEEISTVLDTSGYLPTENILEITNLVDIFLFDIKHMDSLIHERYTGEPNELILSNLDSLSRTGSRIIARIPFVLGFNDSEENIEKTASFLASVGRIEEVRILPYHKSWFSKFEKLEKEWKPYVVQAPSKGAIKNAVDIFGKYGLKVAVGG